MFIDLNFEGVCVGTQAHANHHPPLPIVSLARRQFTHCRVSWTRCGQTVNRIRHVEVVLISETEALTLS